MVKIKNSFIIISLFFAFFLVGVISFICGLFIRFSEPNLIQKFKDFSGKNFTRIEWNKAIDDQEMRGKMIYSFLKKEKIIGIHHTEVSKILGDFTYYHVHDHIPAYIITKNGEEYAIIFTPDSETELIYNIDLILTSEDTFF